MTRLFKSKFLPISLVMLKNVNYNILSFVLSPNTPTIINFIAGRGIAREVLIWVTFWLQGVSNAYLLPKTSSHKRFLQEMYTTGSILKLKGKQYRISKETTRVVYLSIWLWFKGDHWFPEVDNSSALIQIKYSLVSGWFVLSIAYSKRQLTFSDFNRLKHKPKLLL